MAYLIVSPVLGDVGDAQAKHPRHFICFWVVFHSYRLGWLVPLRFVNVFGNASFLWSLERFGRW